MAENDTLLASLAPWIDEDIATEALKHILNKSSASREALDDILRDGGLNIERIREIKTQGTLPDGSRVDMVGYGMDKASPVFIEAKFFAPLTSNQPNSYLNYLIAQPTQSVLLFLTLESRIKSLWPELRTQVERDNKKLVEVESERRCMRIEGTDCHLMVISWRALLDSMAVRTRAGQENPGIEADIVQLKGLTARLNDDQSRPVPDMVFEFGETLERSQELDLREIVRRAISSAERAGIVDTTGLSVGRTSWYYGRYFRFSSSNRDPWLGINHHLWNEFGQSPIWLWFPVGDEGDALRQFQLDAVCQELKVTLYEGNHIPIYLQSGIGQNAAVDGLVRKLKDVSEAIVAATS